jgi:hypothetical protein
MASPEEREKETCTKKLQRKAWVIKLGKTDLSWPSGQISRHANASSGKWFISLQQLPLNTFKHVISQVKLININKFGTYAKYAKVIQSIIDYYQALITK